jgi:hypothetical protein
LPIVSVNTAKRCHANVLAVASPIRRLAGSRYGSSQLGELAAFTGTQVRKVFTTVARQAAPTAKRDERSRIMGFILAYFFGRRGPRLALRVASPSQGRRLNE